ncbi:MAG TPA: transglutaminase domain-containing protein [Ferruginibacter sp.]|jgi:transglutaminase/protease-like cytokinesis protein 3|nr:transglutaminase domain-containing protein [Ferruginibacter sp.]
MILLKKLPIILLLLVTMHATAQKSVNDFQAVDDYVKKVGALDTLNMGTISYIITRQFPDKIDKARAIFDWIANNISFDCKAARADNDKNDNSAAVLKYRMGTSIGYATLFQDMCSVAKVRCLTVDGYIKKSVDDINNKADAVNYMWDVVQLGESSQDWYYIDPAAGSGYTNEKQTVYTKAFNGNYFFADKSIFNSQHFPDNQAWILGNGSSNIKEFYALPIVKDAAYDFSTSGFQPAMGHVVTKTNKAVQFGIRAADNEPITSVALAIGEDKSKKIKPMNYSHSGGYIEFSYKFEDADNYPVTVLINGKEVLSYLIDVED